MASVPTKMRAILPKSGYGPSTTARDLEIVEDVAVPTCKNGEVLVKVKAFGLNRMDVHERKGQYPKPPGCPDIMGVEFSGTVVNVDNQGPEGRWKVGDEVFGLVLGGSYAEYVAARAPMLAEKGSLTWEQAASIPENYLTAYQAMIYIADLQPGQAIMIHAAASGVGLAAIGIGKQIRNAQVFGTAGSTAKLEFISKHFDVPIENLVNYKEAESDFSKVVQKQTAGKGVNFILDPVGAGYYEKNIASLSTDGQLVLIGMMSGRIIQQPVDLGAILGRRLRVQGTTLRARSPAYHVDLFSHFAKDVLPWLHRKGDDIVVHKVYPWAEIASATEEMEADRNIGKIICVVD